MASKTWKKISSHPRLISWKKINKKYPEIEDLAVIQSTDGWVVNHAGYAGNENYYSDNLLVTPSKQKALAFAKSFMRRN